MWGVVTEKLYLPDTALIVDCWNGHPNERQQMTTKLRLLGTDWIEAWYFVTPEDVSLRWFLAREPDNKREGRWGELMLEAKKDSFLHDYHLYHSQPLELAQGFDVIKTINPLVPPKLDDLLRPTK